MTTIQLKYIEDILQFIEEDIFPVSSGSYGSMPRLRPEETTIMKLKIDHIQKAIENERKIETTSKKK